MTALSIQPPYPVFTDTDGQPLEDGYVWIGAANLDPQTNPITVYWDAALTLPAAQPIRTTGGYPANAGTPARLYSSASDYSIRIQTKTGSLVFSSADNNGPLFGGTISSVDVTFLQAGTGAVERTAQAKMRESVSVKDFGAVGDGVTDDTTAIQNALNSGATTVYFPEGTYNVSSPVMINSYTKVYGDGMDTIIQKTNNTTVTLTDPSSGLSYTRNCCFYVNPAYVPNPDHPSGVDAATQVEVSRIRVRFTAAFSVNSSAIFTTQLGRALFQEVYVAGCDWAIDAVRLYLTNVDRVLGRGCRVTVGGTSVNFTSSGGGGTNGDQYVWRLNGLEYSVLSGCAAEDRACGYRFDNCTLTVASCGSELTTSTGTYGMLFDFGDNNNITVTDPIVYPLAAGATGPIMSSSGVNNYIRVIGGNFYKNPGQAGVYDLWIQAYGSIIWFDETIFYDGTTTNLEVQCNGAMNRTGSPAYVRSGGKITKFTPNNVSSPLLQSSWDLLNTSASASEIQVSAVTGGGTFDNFVNKWRANGSDFLILTKRGTASTGNFGAAAGGADLVVDGGTGDLSIGLVNNPTGAIRFGTNGTRRLNVDFHTFPGTDDTYDNGIGGTRWANTFSKNLRPGAGAVIWTSGVGTPEGAVTAPVGSLFTRTDGGAGTTLYVKESGAGNTGWVAK